jgi:hypothetical protein
MSQPGSVAEQRPLAATDLDCGLDQIVGAGGLLRFNSYDFSFQGLPNFGKR